MSWNSNEYTQITQNIIDNIPCTRIVRGKCSQKYNEYIQYLIRKVLYISMTRTDEPYNEVGILARFDGKFESNPMYGYWSDRYKITSINYDNNVQYNNIIEYGEFNKYIFIHNHPDNSRVSLEDIKSICDAPQINTVIAVGNNGNIKYAQKTSNEVELYEYLKKVINRVALKNFGENMNEIAYDFVVNNQDKFKFKIV